MLLARKVVEDMVTHYAGRYFITGSDQFSGQPIHMLFDHMKLEDCTYLSEDYTFCELWLQMGGKVHVWLGADVDHYGMQNFGGDCELMVAESHWRSEKGKKA
jgi:hypothetical protein